MRGFTLVEIALALAVVAGGLVVTVSLLGGLVALAAEAAEATRVRGWSETVRVDVRRRIAAEGYGTFVARLPAWDDNVPAGWILPAPPGGSDRTAARPPVEIWRLDPAGPGVRCVVVRVGRRGGAGFVFVTCGVGQ